MFAGTKGIFYFFSGAAVKAGKFEKWKTAREEGSAEREVRADFRSHVESRHQAATY